MRNPAPDRAPPQRILVVCPCGGQTWALFYDEERDELVPRCQRCGQDTYRRLKTCGLGPHRKTCGLGPHRKRAADGA